MRLILVILAISVAAAGQQLTSIQENPPVIVPGTTNSLLIHVQASGTPSRVAFEPVSQPGTELELKNNGHNLYTFVQPTAPIVSSMQADDVYRPFIGYIKLYRGTALSAKYNVLAEVASAEIPRIAIVSDALDVQHTDYLVNIRSKEAFPASAEGAAIPDPATITRRFYKFFPDDFDVINIIYVPSMFQNRFHFSVRNAVKGIGIPQMDQGEKYGSRKRLQGISIFPLSFFFDGAGIGMQHEFAHQWINQLDFAPVRSGRPHWPLSTMASGIMGFSIPPSREGGDFRCEIVEDSAGIRLVRRRDPPVFGDLDLYLMGLLPSNQAKEQIVLDRQDPSIFSQCNGSLYSGGVKHFQISELIAAVGPRIPDAGAAQKHFRVATIVVTRDTLLGPDAMAFYSYFAQRAELRQPVNTHEGMMKAVGDPFALSTRGLATMSSRITTMPTEAPHQP